MWFYVPMWFAFKSYKCSYPKVQVNYHLMVIAEGATKGLSALAAFQSVALFPNQVAQYGSLVLLS